MISLPELVRSLENDFGEQVEPLLRELAVLLADALNRLEDDLLDQDLLEDERQAILRMVLTALECHMGKLPPPSEEVAFWMKLLDPKVLPLESEVQ